MGQISDRADRYVRKVFVRTPGAPVSDADQKAQQERMKKLAAVRARIVQRRKGF